MGKRYTATIEAKAWKEHTCLNCGGLYSYVLARKVQGQAATAEDAQARAQLNVAKTLATSVDTHPCPTCGLIQPDMIGQKRAGRHITLFIVTLITFAVLLILRAAYAVQANVVTMIAVVFAAVFALLHLLVELKNPNGDPEANRRLAAQSVGSGTIHSAPGRSGTPRPDLVSPPRGIFHTAALALLIVSVVLVALPEIMRSVNGWPLNSVSYPPVAGPGDLPRIYMNDSINSVKGYWRGNPVVTVTPAGGAPISSSGKTNHNDWGNSISAKSSEKDSKSTPWVEAAIPNDPALAGKSVRLEIDLSVSYPKMSGSNTFDIAHQSMHQGVDLQLATPGAGAAYNAYWWQGTAGGAILLLVCGQILRGSARGLQRRANPTRLLGPA